MMVHDSVSEVQGQLAAAAALGDESTKATAEALAVAAEPAIRLAVLRAASQVADEVTTALLDAPGAPAVSVRLDGDEVRVEVRGGDASAGENPAGAFGEDDADPGDSTARISLRLPEALKGRVDAAAREAGVSVNTWLVRAAAASLAGTRTSRGSGPGGRGRSGQRITGWING